MPGADERATCRNSVGYVDDEYPDLVFLVSKSVARQWRCSENQVPDHATLSVYMRRRQDPLLLLDLPSRALLRLRPRCRQMGEEVVARVRSMLITDQHGRRADVEIVLV